MIKTKHKCRENVLLYRKSENRTVKAVIIGENKTHYFVKYCTGNFIAGELVFDIIEVLKTHNYKGNYIESIKK